MVLLECVSCIFWVYLFYLQDVGYEALAEGGHAINFNLSSS